MLKMLRISNFAIIDQLQIHFDRNLITFTGETGAGKSIIIDAVETILGGRVDDTMIRSGSERAIVEGEFMIPAVVREEIHQILVREDLLDDPDYVILGREIRRQGRNLARLNGRSVTLAILREVGEYLVDVHGQSEHLSLLRVREHLRLLDNFAGLESPLSKYQITYQSLRQVRSELEMLHEAERDSARRADLLDYQINEIDEAALETSEEDSLKNERLRLANAESISLLAKETLLSLDDDDLDSVAATDVLGQTIQTLKRLLKTDPGVSEYLARAQDAFDSVTDLALDIRSYLETVEFNPERLEEVEERLALIQNLKRKYGGSIPEVLAFADQARQDLDNITHAEERIAALDGREKKLLVELAKYGEELFSERESAAEKLAGLLELELDDLRMEGARFKVDFQRRPDPDGVVLSNGDRVAFGPNGLEWVQFLVAPNPGEGLKPLAKIASGGEMSRLMLALKNVLAQADRTPTLIFDEIDQGIGGRVGAVVGEKLKQLAEAHQVLCITHLPQLAAYGSQHYRVQKLVDSGRTSTQVVELEGENRLIELAQMLGDVSEGTLQSAREILAGIP